MPLKSAHGVCRIQKNKTVGGVISRQGEMDVATHAIRETKVGFDSSFDAKEQVRQAIDIVDLLSKYNLQLRRQGRGYVALCPWHDDTRPSLQINPERQSWKCWPCDIGGDIFSFVMKIEGVDFPEALAMLADRAGITITKPSRGEGGAAASSGTDKRTLYKAASWVERQYHECLLHSSEAEPARQYFQERGISDESIQRFQLGFAPLDRDWILKQAGGSGARAKVLETIGVLARSSQGGYPFDRFRGRGLFTIRDAQGRPVGMGGRLLPGVEINSPAKYINSPETPLFRKSHLLYGLDLAKEAIHKSKQKTALVMEGYTDVIIAHQFGFNNAVAVLGVALGETHIKILKRFVDRIVLVLDGDEAGQKRANEVLELFIAQQADLRILTLPDDLDPCEFLQQRGADAFAELLATGTVDALDHAFNTATRGIDLERDVHAASQALERLIAMLAKAPRLQADTSGESRLREERFLQRFATMFRVSESEVRRRLTELRRRNSARSTGRNEHGMPAKAGTPAPPEGGTANEPIDTYERELLELLVIYPETWAAARAALLPAQIASSALRRIYETGCRLLDENVLPGFERLILEFDDPALKSLLVDLDEQGRAKGSRAAEPPELLNDLLIFLERKEVEKQRPGHMATLRERRLDDVQELDLLENILQQERSRQGISRPTEG
jgi:DNA primase